METRHTFKLLFFVKKQRINSNGEVPIYLRITIDNQSTDMSLHRSIKLNSWNRNSNCAKGSSKNSKEINSYLQSVQSTIYEHYKYLRETNKVITPNSLKNAYLGKKYNNLKGERIIKLFIDHNDKMKKLEGVKFTRSTVLKYELTLKHTQNFIKKKYKKDDLYLTELNNEFITDYSIYYLTERKCSINTTLKYIRSLKKIINIAIANGFLDNNPFFKFKMKPEKIDRGFLSDKELDLIINTKIDIERLERIRDCFVFACFTGLAHSDLKRLSQKNIVIGTDGKQWIKINRLKTSTLSSIPVLPLTQKIIDKYENHPVCMINGTLLPVISNQNMNIYLKEIAKICNISQNLTCHLARHTFATTVTLNNDVPLESVSKMLGHTSTIMTRIYARLLDKKVGQDMSKLHEIYK